jgi:hypothetical protein
MLRDVPGRVRQNKSLTANAAIATFSAGIALATILTLRNDRWVN